MTLAVKGLMMMMMMMMIMVIHTGGYAFRSFFPFIIYGNSSIRNHYWTSICGKRKCRNHQNFGRSNIFSDQCYELLCSVLRNFADPRHGWITRASPPARKNGEKQKVMQKRDTPIYGIDRHMVRLKINVSVSGTVAVSVSVHMKSLHYLLLQSRFLP